MIDYKPIIDRANEWAINEIEKHGLPSIEHFELSNEKGQEFAKRYGVDTNIVMLGTILMDVKLGECFKEGKIQEHVKRSSEASKEFLKQFDLDEESVNKIINCIEAHHGTIPFSCKESEICANADCYRFIHPKGVFTYFKILGKRFDDLGKVLEQVNMKMEEKWAILTLEDCKQELEEYYTSFKKYLREAGLDHSTS